jgi:hypothetical protein
MEVPRQYIGANVRLGNLLGLASLKMPVKAVMHVMLLIIIRTVSIYLSLFILDHHEFNTIKWRTRRQ